MGSELADVTGFEVVADSHGWPTRVSRRDESVLVAVAREGQPPPSLYPLLLLLSKLRYPPV